MPNKNWSTCESREKVIMIPKKEIIQEGSNVTRRIEKIIYEYCLCDICLGEVIIKDYSKEYQRNGGIINFRNPRGRCFPIILHNKCLKEGMAELNKYYENYETERKN